MRHGGGGGPRAVREARAPDEGEHRFRSSRTESSIRGMPNAQNRRAAEPRHVPPARRLLHAPRCSTRAILQRDGAEACGDMVGHRRGRTGVQRSRRARQRSPFPPGLLLVGLLLGSTERVGLLLVLPRPALQLIDDALELLDLLAQLGVVALKLLDAFNVARIALGHGARRLRCTRPCPTAPAAPLIDAITGADRCAIHVRLSSPAGGSSCTPGSGARRRAGHARHKRGSSGNPS